MTSTDPSYVDVEEDRASTIRQPSFHALDDEGDRDTVMLEGDYSSRMEELLSNGSDSPVDDSDDDEGFVYTGKDAVDISGNYGEQLQEILGSEHDESHTSDSGSEIEIERSLLVPDGNEKEGSDEEGFLSPKLSESLFDHSNLSTTTSLPITPLRVASPGINGNSKPLARPFLHPSISRLRSSMPHSHGTPSESSAGTLHSHTFDGPSPPTSHFSSMSRKSSLSDVHAAAAPDDGQTGGKQIEREVFKWTQLRVISHDLYAKRPQKLSAILGSLTPGSPTALAANGLICVGTDHGKIFVYDFKQMLRCICGTDHSLKTVGPVTALALSHDHTYVASGHASGHIQLFDLNKPQVPARFVPPTTLGAVLSGRKEGHLAGTRISSIGFVAGRHTAIVSADEYGLAFYHSLGKVLFVEASDTLRILGKYPQEEIDPLSRTTSASSQMTVTGSMPTPIRGRKTRYTILAMMPLPLGTSPHPTDAYNIIALLTPAKLVIVGLKPTPRTWFKRSRTEVGDSGSGSNSKWKGSLAWFPSTSSNVESKPVPHKKGADLDRNSSALAPMLVYSWGNTLYLMRVLESKLKRTVRDPRTGKNTEIDVGNVVLEDVGKWSSEDVILSVQWLNVNQIVIVTSTTLEVYDMHISKLVERIQFDSLSLVSPSCTSTINGASAHADAVGDVSHRVRVYKGKLFLLGRDDIKAGTLLTWADRILSFVDCGDFLSAIDMARSYYLGEAPGNTNGLPDDITQRREIVGERMRALMRSSAQYAFSEDRMTDGTHFTPDGRGVDRTALFEGLVSSCARACIALDDYDFLFEDLFQQYDDSGISQIFLLQLQTFVLDNSIRNVPPRITQGLVRLHEDDGHPDLAERIIWHIDPACLDINQAIRLCQTHQLYDALLYVYTRAMRDYVSPVVELLGLIRKVQQCRRSRTEYTGHKSPSEMSAVDSSMDSDILNAYKIYPYLANVLSGLTYPSGEPLEETEASQAKTDIYTFLFFGRSSLWPRGEGGELVLTAEEEGGIEPTYPYVRLLLRFDSESFLHSLDIVFEDPYLNDDAHGISRHIIVKILLEILGSKDLPSSDGTFVNIFVARNVPKYPQFIQIKPSSLHGILIGLAEDPDQSTREDRQLAAEYLLSVYNPHESERIRRLFETAQFYRILRSWYRQERRWAPLLLTYLHDCDLRHVDLFNHVDDVLGSSTRTNQGTLPTELLAVITDALPQLLQGSILRTAWLIDAHLPQFHEKALDAFGPHADHERSLYLRHLLGPPQSDDEDVLPSKASLPSPNVSRHLHQLHISLQCQYHPSEVIDTLKFLPPDNLDWSEVLQTCEANEVFDAVVWAYNWRGEPQKALSKATSFGQKLTLRIVNVLSVPDHVTTPSGRSTIRREIAALQTLGRTAVDVCLERSRDNSDANLSLEDLWFQLLSSQISAVQNVSSCCSAETLSGSNNHVFDDEIIQLEWETLAALRSFIQETFTSLVSVSSSRAVSFPRLFKRLVDPANHAHSSAGTPYKEFRTILTSMLESYRSEGDMLIITKHSIDRDLFETLEILTRERAKGWAPSRTTCSICRRPFLKSHNCDPITPESIKSMHILVSRTGDMHHSSCPV